MFQNNKLFLLLLVGFYSVFGYLWWTWISFLGQTPYYSEATYSEAIPEEGILHYLVAYWTSWAILLLFPPVLGRAFGRLLKRIGGKDNFHRLLPVLNVATRVWVLLSIVIGFLSLQRGRESLATGLSLVPPSFLFLTYGIMVGMDQAPVWWDYLIVDERLDKRSQRSQLFGKGHLPMITWCFILAYLQFFPVIFVGMICLLVIWPILEVFFIRPTWVFSFTIEILVLFPGVYLAIYTYLTITVAVLLWWIYFQDWRSHKQNLKKLRNE